MTRRTWILELALLLLTASVMTGCPTCSYLCYRVFPDYPEDEDDTIELAGLSDTVSVAFDQAGVPHIEALNERDLLRAVGFAQARSRFFQMDMLRRLAQGRLSELVGDQPILGGTTVQMDLAMRWWSFEQGARDDVNEADGDLRELLDAYIEGVNAALGHFEPVEYRLLDLEPEPWRLEDSFAVGRLIAWSITHNYNQETSRLILALHGGIERAEQIYPSEPWPGTSSLPPEQVVQLLPGAIAPEIRTLFEELELRSRTYNQGGSRGGTEMGLLPDGSDTASPATHSSVEAGASNPAHLAALESQPQAPMGPMPGETASRLAAMSSLQSGGSNAWVVGGARSTSGMPILANDPHLTHFLPSVLYQQHMRCPGLDVIGATVPGLPYVLFGHNQHVAWGMTSAVGDVVDLYVERANPDDPAQVMGLDGRWETLAEEEVAVQVRTENGFEVHRAVFRSSRNGRLVNDLYPGLFPDWAPPVSMHWHLSGGATSLAAFGLADRARSIEELRSALALIVSPVNTWTAADDQGRVALFAAGWVPQRPNHLGTFAVPGWLPDYQWRGPIEPEAMPAAIAGSEGVFVHTNNLMRPPRSSIVPFHVDTGPSYRFDRVMEMLRAEDRHTMQSLARIQTDTRLLQGERLAPIMVADLMGDEDPTPIESIALDILAHWDFESPADAVAPTIFHQTYLMIFIEALKDEVDEAGLAFILSERYATNPADLWFDDPEHPVWDDLTTPAIERRHDIVRRAFALAVSRLEESLGADPDEWRWGRLHDYQPRHAFGGRESLAGLVNLEATGLPGGADSVWKAHFDLGNADHPFRVIAGPVLRMVVDLADIQHGLWILDTGASGWPDDPHYGDQYERWLAGEYLPMNSDWSEIRSSAVGVLTLEP